MSTETRQVEMTAAELAAFEEFKATKKKELEAARRKEMRAKYADMVDEEVKAAVEQLTILSGDISTVKKKVYENFKTILDMKAEVIGDFKDGQRSHTFTTSDSTMRVTLGKHCVDAYRDTVEEGIAMVKSYIESLANDKKTEALVKAVLRLLSRDNMGNIKASRVLQLRRMAEDSGDETFIEGVRIIEEAYQPAVTKSFVRAEIKDEMGAWKSIPLGMTECGN